MPEHIGAEGNEKVDELAMKLLETSLPPFNIDPLGRTRIAVCGLWDAFFKEELKILIPNGVELQKVQSVHTEQVLQKPDYRD